MYKRQLLKEYNIPCISGVDTRAVVKKLRESGTMRGVLTSDIGDRERLMDIICLLYTSHLELQRYFGIYKTLSPETCDEIWEKCNAKIKKGGFSPRELIEK